MEFARQEKVTLVLGANSHWLHLEQDLTGNLTSFYQITAHQIASSQHDSRVKTHQCLSFLISTVVLEEEPLPKPLPPAEASGSYRRPTWFRTTPSHSTQESHTSTSNSCQQWQKAPISNNLWQSHNSAQKHCLKKCQFSSLDCSSACIQIQRSSVSTSRDQFDRQILLIPKHDISLWVSC